MIHASIELREHRDLAHWKKVRKAMLELLTSIDEAIEREKLRVPVGRRLDHIKDRPKLTLIKGGKQSDKLPN